MQSTYLGTLCKRGHASPEDPTRTRRNSSGGCPACHDHLYGRDRARAARVAKKAEKDAALAAKLAARQAKTDARQDQLARRQQLASLGGLALVRELLDYDPTTGAITARMDRGPLTEGKPVGWVHPKGFLRISINGKQHAAHRLVYWMVTGTPPVYEVVALNGNKLDLRWSNLHQMSEEEQDAFDEWVMGVARKDPNGPPHPGLRQTNHEASMCKPAHPPEPEDADPLW